MTTKKTTKKKQFKDFKPAKPVKINIHTGKKPETKKPDESKEMIFVSRHKTQADRENELISFAVGLCWGLIVAQIMRVYYGKEKSKKENTQAAVRRE